MNQYVTGSVIKNLREKNNLTQAELADKLNVSDKAVSKWETGKGYPDITLLEPIAKVFGVSITELMSGNAVNNMNKAANMMRSKLYICPVCGNVIHCIGEAAVSCHGVLLSPAEADPPDDKHLVTIDRVEDEYYVQVKHEMCKTHYISFIAALSQDKLQLVKLYAEGNAEARFKINGVKHIYFYCNKDGLFLVDVNKLFAGK